MVNFDYVAHEVFLAMELLMIGVKNAKNKHVEEILIMRAALNILEFLSRYIEKQSGVRRE